MKLPEAAGLRTFVTKHRTDVKVLLRQERFERSSNTTEPLIPCRQKGTFQTSDPCFVTNVRRPAASGSFISSASNTWARRILKADVDVIALLWRFLSDLSLLRDLTLELNSLGSAADRAAYLPVLVSFLKSRIRRTSVTIASGAWRRIPCACSIAKCRVVARRQRTPLNLVSHLSPQAKSHFDEVLSTLAVLDIPWRLNPRLVRGLDYYCLTAFEITSSHLGAQNAVGAGGRYDGLVELLGGPETPAVGFAAGLERIAMMLPEK